MLIAKMAQWNKEWQVSLDACRKIEEKSTDLWISTRFEDIPFRMKNTPESLSLRCSTPIPPEAWDYTSNLACLCMPYRRSGGKYDGVVIEELGDNATCWAPAQANNYLVNNLLAEENNDLLRRDHDNRTGNGTARCSTR